MPNTLTISIPELPPFVEFKLVRLPQDVTKKLYGSYGDGGEHMHEPPPPAVVPEWHCNMTLTRQCGECGKIEPYLWPRGHGHSPEQAISEAFRGYAMYVNGRSTDGN